MPNYGGNDGHGVTGFKITGDGPIPTPRQLVAMLDQYVIGQEQAKRVSATISSLFHAVHAFLAFKRYSQNGMCTLFLSFDTLLHTVWHAMLYRQSLPPGCGTCFWWLVLVTVVQQLDCAVSCDSLIAHMGQSDHNCCCCFLNKQRQGSVQKALSPSPPHEWLTNGIMTNNVNAEVVCRPWLWQYIIITSECATRQAEEG